MRKATSPFAFVLLTGSYALMAPVAARADSTSQELGWHDSYDIDQEASGVKLTTTNGELVQSLEISGANASTDDQPEVLKPGESWRKSLQVDVTSDDGTLFNTQFRGNFTDVWLDPGYTLGNLQVLGGTGDGNRALTDLYFSADFLNDRISVSSESEASTWVPINDYRDTTRGLSQQLRASALLFQSGSAKLSVDAVSSHVDPNYWNLTNASVTDPLLVRNEATSQLRSTATMDRFTLNLFRRQSEMLTASHPGDILPQQSETGAGASVLLSDFRVGSEGLNGAMSTLIPDSIWITRSQGDVTARQDNSETFGPVRNGSIGANRSWTSGNAYVSYWSTIQAVPENGSPGIWSGHGTDFGGNVNFGQWNIYGGLSQYSSSSVGWLNNTAENSVTGTLLVSWKSTDWPTITAGVVSYAYGYSTLDFGGFNGSDLRRYEVSLDFSRPMSAQLGRDISLKVLATYCGTAAQWRWEDAGYDQELGSVFAGVRLEFPFQP